MHRTALLLALLAGAPAVAAQRLPAPGQFLDKSIVTLPASTRDYRLANVRYDPAQWMQGVVSRWVVNAAPGELRLTMFVHPMGRTGEENAVALQLAEVAHFMGAAVKQGVYADLVAGEPETFVVPTPEPSLFEADKAAAGEESVIDATDASPETRGKRQAFAFSDKGVPMRSFDYVFHRHLFAFKVRVAAPVESMDEFLFAALADTAARKLVAGVDVRNYGQCGVVEAGDELARARARADNCAAVDDGKPADESVEGRRIEIVYPPDTWRTGG